MLQAASRPVGCSSAGQSVPCIGKDPHVEIEACVPCVSISLTGKLQVGVLETNHCVKLSCSTNMMLAAITNNVVCLLSKFCKSLATNMMICTWTIVKYKHQKKV